MVWSFLKNVTMHCTQKLKKVIQLPGDDIDLKVNFQGLNGPKRVKFWCFATFSNFLIKRRDNFCTFLIYSFLGDIDQLSRDGLD